MMTANPEDRVPDEVVLASSIDPPEGLGPVLAEALSTIFEIPQRALTVVSRDDPGDLATDITAALSPADLLLMTSGHADRWRSRPSVTEHVLDAFGGTAIVIGPRVETAAISGPIMVAVDGSPAADQALVFGDGLARAAGTSVVLCRVIPEPIRGENPGFTEAEAHLDRLQTRPEASTTIDALVIASNDPVATIASAARNAGCSLIVVVSKGDRSSARAAMSRTATGLAAEAACPVAVVPA